MSEHILFKKAEALKYLGCLGFVDNQSTEFPGTIFHHTIGCVDVSSLSPANFVEIIYNRGKLDGIQQIQYLNDIKKREKPND